MVSEIVSFNSDFLRGFELKGQLNTLSKGCQPCGIGALPTRDLLNSLANEALQIRLFRLTSDANRQIDQILVSRIENNHVGLDFTPTPKKRCHPVRPSVGISVDVSVIFPKRSEIDQ